MSLRLFLEVMDHIVRVERRPFSYRDFLSFEHNGKSYKFDDGTIRNYFSKLRKKSKIEIVYKSKITFYTLKGVKVGKTMTPDHTGGTSTISTATTTAATTTTAKGLSHKGSPLVNRSGSSLNYKQHRFLQFLLNIPMDIDGIHDVRLRFTAKGLWEILPMYNDFKYLIKKMDAKTNRDIVLHDIQVTYLKSAGYHNSLLTTRRTTLGGLHNCIVGF